MNQLYRGNGAHRRDRSHWIRRISQGRCLAVVLALVASLGAGWHGHAPDVHASGTDSAPNQIVVTLMPGASIATFNAAHGTSTAELLPDGHTYVLNLPATETAGDASAQWGSDPSVAMIEPNYQINLLAWEQFYLAADGSGSFGKAQGQWALATIEATAAQSISVGSGITVAVLDSGVDSTNPMLAGHIIGGGYDYISQTATISDVAGGPASGHGTFVAGMVVQVAPGARILPFRVLDTNGLGTVANVAHAIESAVNEGARVINMSMGMAANSQTLHEAVLYAQVHKVVVVAAAGNQNTSAPQYPAAWPGVVAVAGTDQNDVRAPFSNYGTWISVSAPAVNLYSAYPGGYADGSGTSFAAPLVSGEVALLEAAHLPASSGAPAQVAQGSIDINDINPAFDDLLGAGRIDALHALVGGSPD